MLLEETSSWLRGERAAVLEDQYNRLRGVSGTGAVGRCGGGGGGGGQQQDQQAAS